jgi:hypothetical protein
LRALGLKPADFVSLKPAAKEDKAATDKAKEDKAKEDKAAEDKKIAAEEEERKRKEKDLNPDEKPTRPGTFSGEIVGNYIWNAGDYRWEKYTGF